MFPQMPPETAGRACLWYCTLKSAAVPSCIDLVQGFQVKTDLRCFERECEDGRESCQLFQSANRQDGVLSPSSMELSGSYISNWCVGISSCRVPRNAR